MASVKLKVSEEVAAGSSVADEFTPASGKELIIKAFHGSAAFSQNAMTALIWKYNHATESEVVIWSTEGVDHLPDVVIIDRADVDGVRKMAVVCDNGETGPLMLSAYAEINVRD